MRESLILNSECEFLQSNVACGGNVRYTEEAGKNSQSVVLCDASGEYAGAVSSCRLYVDEDFNIRLLIDECIVITMEPLPKALYLLFLRHPEGIVLKKISEYREELEYIYRKVSSRKNPTVIRRLMNEIPDPLNNSVHKNLSTIRMAFLEKLPSDVAELFIPTRNHGRKKYVSLPVSCIKLPENLH